MNDYPKYLDTDKANITATDVRGQLENNKDAFYELSRCCGASVMADKTCADCRESILTFAKTNPELLKQPDGTYEGMPVKIFWSTEAGGRVTIQYPDKKWGRVAVADMDDAAIPAVNDLHSFIHGGF